MNVPVRFLRRRVGGRAGRGLAAGRRGGRGRFKRALAAAAGKRHRRHKQARQPRQRRIIERSFSPTAPLLAERRRARPPASAYHSDFKARCIRQVRSAFLRRAATATGAPPGGHCRAPCRRGSSGSSPTARRSARNRPPRRFAARSPAGRRAAACGGATPFFSASATIRPVT